MDKRNLVMFPGTEAVKEGGGSIRTRLTDRIGQLSFLQRPVQFLAAKKWMILLTFMGFLLGRAMILGELSPFAVAYFAVIAFMRRDYLLPVGIAIVAGSLFASFPVAWMVPAEILIFYFMLRGLETYDRLNCLMRRSWSLSPPSSLICSRYWWDRA